MTREELVEMTGSEEQANYAIGIILKQLKPQFISNCINAELSDINAKISKLKSNDIIYTANGSEHVNWGAKSEDCYTAEGLLYTRNRMKSLVAAR